MSQSEEGAPPELPLDPVVSAEPDPGEIPLETITAGDEPDPGPLTLEEEWRGTDRSDTKRND
jgi:hypothetical protein